MKQKVLKVHPDDNVIVALQDLPKAAVISFNEKEYVLQDDVPAKHKFLEEDLQPGGEVIMYGVLVGKAQQFIPAGSRVTVFNVKHAAEPYAYRGSHYRWQAPDVSRFNLRLGLYFRKQCTI